MRILSKELLKKKKAVLLFLVELKRVKGILKYFLKQIFRKEITKKG